jgi:hypothetical protein
MFPPWCLPFSALHPSTSLQSLFLAPGRRGREKGERGEREGEKNEDEK